MQHRNIGMAELTPNQQAIFGQAIASLMRTISNEIPQLGPQLCSGGAITIQTMSGCNLRMMFAPQVGGLIVPGGINPTQGIIKP